MKRVANKLSLKGKLSLKRNKTDVETKKPDEGVLEDKDSSKPSLLESVEPPPPYAGLQNLGNTCFFNSVVQALRYTPSFRDEIRYLANLVKGLEREEEERMSNGDYEAPGVTTHMRLLAQIDKLFRSMQRAEEQYIEEFEIRSSLSVYPENLLNILKKIKPMFDGYLQHDAQELLCCFLSIIQDGCQELKSRLNGNNNPESVPDKMPQEKNLTSSGKLLGGIKAVSSTEVEHCPRPSSNTVTRKISTGTVAEIMPQCDGRGKKKTLGIRRFKRPPPNQTTMSMFGVVSENSVTKNTKEANEVEHGNAAKKLKIEPETATKKRKDETDNSKAKSKINSNSLDVKKNRKSNAKVQVKEEKTIQEKKSELKLEKNYLEEMEAEPESLPVKKSDEVLPKLEPDPEKREAMCNFSSTTNNLDLVERLFQGLVVSRTRCSECEKFNERTEDFQEVGLPVQKMSDSSSTHDCDLMPTNLSLSWALAEYTCTERLTDKNKYFCERCMQHNEAERSVLFHKLPAVLIFHLKRFSTVFSGFYPDGSVSKVNTHLATPLTLTLTPWCSTECEQRHQCYELYAFVMHSGTSSSSGHYVCYAQVPSYNVKPIGTNEKEPSNLETSNKSKWARFDDDMVELLTEDDISSILCPITTVHHSSTPYLLFYRKVT